MTAPLRKAFRVVWITLLALLLDRADDAEFAAAGTARAPEVRWAG